MYLFSSIKSSYLRLISYLVIALALGGCVGGVKMLPTLSESTELQSNQGVIVVRVINTSSYPLPFNQLTIIPKNINESKKIKPSRLEALRVSTTKSTIFSAQVSSGSYSLDSLRSYHVNGQMWFSRWVEADAKFGTFEIKPGQVTDLGTIIYYPKPQEDKYLNTLVRQTAENKGTTLDSYFPFFSYSKNNVIGWNEDEYEEERNNAFISSAQNPVTFNDHYLAPDNSLYFIGKLGVILKRTAEGEWQTDAVDTNLDLNTIAQNNQQDLVVGGNEGQVFLKKRDQQWQDISITHDHDIAHISWHSNKLIDIISRQETQMTVYRVNIEGKKPLWSTLASYSYFKGWLNSQGQSQHPKKKKKKKSKWDKRIVEIKLDDYDSQNYVTIRLQSFGENYVFSSGDRLKFSYDPQTWQVSKNNVKTQIPQVFDAGAVKLKTGYDGLWSWTIGSSYLKFDSQNHTWSEMDTAVRTCKEDYQLKGTKCVLNHVNFKSKSERFNFISMPWFSSNLEAIAIASFPDYNYSGSKRDNEVKIIVTADGGKSWKKTERKLPKEYCTSLIPELKDRLLLSCNGGSGDFYQSFDQGVSWQQVREQENF